jgi:hypothetical protein
VRVEGCQDKEKVLVSTTKYAIEHKIIKWQELPRRGDGEHHKGAELMSGI